MGEHQKPKKRSLISTMLLVAGCCIGGGMLGLPVASGGSGFIPSLAMMAVAWLGMTLSALLLLEVSLWMEGESHVISMTSRLLGPIGKAVAWVLFLYISYASLVAYAAGGGAQISHFLSYSFDIPIGKDIGAILLTLAFTFVIIFGGETVGKVNTLLFAGMIGAYFLLITSGVDEVKPKLLEYQKWSLAPLAIPFLLTSFSFQTMVPSLTPILKRHPKALRLSIVGGTTIAFIVYALWQMLILGIIPVDGPEGLLEANRQSVPATQFIESHVEGSLVVTISRFFTLFAIVTSYLAMGLGLFDFLADGFTIKKQGKGIWILGAMIAIPTLLFSTQFERAFMVAMETSGGIGDTILNGMIPVLMIWIGRYKLGIQNSFRVPGGKILLIAVFAFFMISFLIEMGIQSGILSADHLMTDKLELLEPALMQE